MILSAHLPPAQGKTAQLLKLLADVPTSEPFVAPNQAAVEQILAQIAGNDQPGYKADRKLRLSLPSTFWENFTNLTNASISARADKSAAFFATIH
jgi:hypothetical protein